MLRKLIDPSTLPTAPSANPVTGSLYFDNNTFQIMVYYKGRWAPLGPLRDLLNEFFTDIKWKAI